MAHTLINPDISTSYEGVLIGVEGMGIITLTASWSNKFKTKGIIPKIIARNLFKASDEIIGLILESGLWEEDDNNYFFTTNGYIVFEGHEHRLKVSPSIRAKVFANDGGKCKQCGSDSDLQVDHIIPWSKGGAHGIHNFQTLCGTCNRKKGAKQNG